MSVSKGEELVVKSDSEACAAVQVLLREDLCEALCEALCTHAPGLAHAGALACAGPRDSPLPAVVLRFVARLLEAGPRTAAHLFQPAPCAVGSSSRGVDVLCGHGLCRGQPPRMRDGVGRLLTEAEALGPIAAVSAYEMKARCLDECRRPSLWAWRRAAGAGSPSAQLHFAKLQHRAPGHEAARECVKVFKALSCQREASDWQRATAHLHLGFAYVSIVPWPLCASQAVLVFVDSMTPRALLIYMYICIHVWSLVPHSFCRLQHTATYCNILQHSATCLARRQRDRSVRRSRCRTLSKNPDSQPQMRR